MKFPYKAILFDWAYTLVDLVKEDDRSAFLRLFDFLREKGLTLPDFELAFATYQELFYKMIKISRETHREARFDVVLKHLLLQYRIDLHDKTTLEELLNVYYKEIYSPRKVYPETVATLEKLKMRGVRMGVVCNTTNPGFMKDYESVSFGLDRYFEFAIYSSEVPFRKPHPSIFSLAVARLGLEVREILFVGDDLQADIKGAQGAGISTAWVNRERKSISENIRPEYEIHSLDEVLSIDSVTACE